MSDRPPAAKSETLRSELRASLRAAGLRGESLTSRELSQAVGASEREVLEHLPHLARSLAHATERMAIEPSKCLACGFEFEDRTRLKRPGKCPECRSTRISPPRFRILE